MGHIDRDELRRRNDPPTRRETFAMIGALVLAWSLAIAMVLQQVISCR